MRTYVLVTGIIFGLLAILHGWRVAVEGPRVGTDPWFLVITALAAALCGWAVWLLRRPQRA